MNAHTRYARENSCKVNTFFLHMQTKNILYVIKHISSLKEKEKHLINATMH